MEYGTEENVQELYLPFATFSGYHFANHAVKTPKSPVMIQIDISKASGLAVPMASSSAAPQRR